MKIWLISDTHNGHDRLIPPDGIDMVIHAGDFTVSKNPAFNANEADNFLGWYSTLNIRHKVLVPGNHDTSVEAGMVTFPDGITVLMHEAIDIDGIKIFGSPYTPEFHNWAFNVPRKKLAMYWDQIPDDIDILVTHGPPFGVLDRNNEGKLCGCEALWKQLRWFSPKYHVFGHIHEECGKVLKLFGHETTFINASICNLEYIIVNNGYVIEM